MTSLLPFVSMGSSYYPPHHDPPDWERDVQRMAAAGLNTIRTAELLASWDKIEKVRGAPDWSWLDRIFELAQEYGLKILLGTGSCNPPIWIKELYPDIQIISRDGVPYPTATVWGWASKAHPGYRFEVQRYLGLLLERYGQHPALLGWQIYNEPGFPLMKREGSANVDHYDYGPHSVRRFRAWLKAKYQDIAAINVAWRWDPTHHQYSDWYQIDPPRSMPSEWGGVTMWLDWREFQYDMLAEWIAMQHAQIKARFPQQPTMTNIFAFSGREIMMAMDGDRLARAVDAIGYDLYPGIEGRLNAEPEYIAMFLDFGRCNAQRNQREFWLPEIESGPVDGWVLGPDHNTSAEDILRYNLQGLARGARQILYQGYREWPCIPIHWGALVDFHGEPTPRYEMAAKINALVKEHDEFFRQAQPTPARVAIVYDLVNHTALHGMAAVPHLRLALRGCYSALWSQGYRVDFTTPEEVMRGAHRYDVLLLPFLMLVNDETGAALKEFVRKGGTLIGFAKCAMLDHRGWSHADRPGAGLSEVFGVLESSISKAAPENLSILLDNGHHVQGYWHQQLLKLASDTRVLGTFEHDGTPAVVEYRYGQGRAYYIATHVDMAHALKPTWEQRALFARMLDGVGREVVLEPLDGQDIALTVEARLLHHAARSALIITNNGAQPVTLKVGFEGSGGAWTDLFSGQLWTAGEALTIAAKAGTCLMQVEAY
ncbi:MAG: beta-galactosidase [Chloroflexi bacterium]|nr:beta-galactosidase [Chloroflexota bacterium]